MKKLLLLAALLALLVGCFTTNPTPTKPSEQPTSPAPSLLLDLPVGQFGGN